MEKQGLTFPKAGSPEKIIYTFDDDTDDAFNQTISIIKDFKYARYTPLLYLKDKKKYATMLASQRNMGGFMKGIWRKSTGLSNRQVRENPREAVVQWAEYLLASGMSQSTCHTMVVGCCTGLGIVSDKICHHGLATDKHKSLGNSERAKAARKKASNADLVRFQEMVGGRRNALARLTGKDFGYDRFGNAFVIFRRDKGGKDHHQLLIDSDVAAVKAYFDQVGPDELLFPKLDHDLDLHGIRAERARRAYRHYAKVASTPEGREHLRQQLWDRYTDPEIGCKAWLIAKEKGDKARMRKLEYRFRKQMADGDYYLRGANREAAIQRGRPIKYDRLSILATSVFSLSHWRLDICAKSYLI